MKKLSFLLFAVVMLFAACNGDEPNGPSIFPDGQEDVSGGSVIATFKCKDAADESISHEGYIIQTANNDTVLTFQLDNVNALNALSVQEGVTVINPTIAIPYAFTCFTIAPESSQYVHWAPLAQDALREMFAKPLEEMDQVIITPDSPQEISKEDLFGTWSEHYNQGAFKVKSLTFQADGVLIYTEKPDTTNNIVLTEAPNSIMLQYVVKDSKLQISGECTKYPFGAPSYTETFTYSTGCSIKDDELTLYMFSYDGVVTIKPFILYKQ